MSAQCEYMLDKADLSLAGVAMDTTIVLESMYFYMGIPSAQDSKSEVAGQKLLTSSKSILAGLT